MPMTTRLHVQMNSANFNNSIYSLWVYFTLQDNYHRGILCIRIVFAVYDNLT